MFFLQRGFVKVGTITATGNELIYDVRKGGDVVGELCAAEEERPDRAVALEATDAIVVPFEDIKSLLMTEPSLMAALIEVFCTALKQAYAQINTLAVDDTVHRLANILVGLAKKIGRPSGSLLEIPTYLTQEEIAQMIAARRERVSTALNFLRRRGDGAIHAIAAIFSSTWRDSKAFRTGKPIWAAWAMRSVTLVTDSSLLSRLKEHRVPI